MDVSRYLGHIPQIEKWIEESRLDAIVAGLGPSFWLLRYCNRKLFADIRLFGVHDACRVMPVDDLIVMDSPTLRLHPDYDRHKAIVDGRPKRLWIMDWHYDEWLPYIHPAMRTVATKKRWLVWPSDQMRPTRKGETKPALHKKKLSLFDEHPHTAFISPTGATTLAWELGCRRIGVIGVDMMPGQHNTAVFSERVDAFFHLIAKQAKQAGGMIRSLSPLTSLKVFSKWSNQSECLSAATSSSMPPEPSLSLSTRSGSTALDPSLSSSCAQETAAGPSAKPAILSAPGS